MNFLTKLNANHESFTRESQMHTPRKATATYVRTSSTTNNTKKKIVLWCGCMSVCVFGFEVMRAIFERRRWISLVWSWAANNSNSHSCVKQWRLLHTIVYVLWWFYTTSIWFVLFVYWKLLLIAPCSCMWFVRFK